MVEKQKTKERVFNVVCIHLYRELPALWNIYGQVFWYQPEQVHISYGDNVYEIVVTWNGGPLKKSQYIHTVKLKDLTPDSFYVYHCGSDYGWSNLFSFRTASNASDWQPHLAIFGDMGNENAQSLVRLQEEAQRGIYDAILHVGDFAYDMDSDNAEVGDAFMRQIESIAAYLPYMTCPGNHEEMYNFSNYRERFNMPGGHDSYMFSINIGPMHIISISTEVYYFLNYGIKPLIFQYDWLEKDLANANLPENREKQPWIIVMGHRPMYCSNLNHDDCTHYETLTRVGLPFLHFFGLEQLLYNYAVDLEIWAHEHSYERLWPIYNYTVYNGSYEQPYVNPQAPFISPLVRQDARRVERISQ
ncbi:hypothetical protein NQ318_015768 [Aromia moschata]|uniref:Purple acid phosphatase n=1 Tax=Aromia moschata TaxID=1265417 RepID=A0AAV8XP53_9CUCU|nr:hypothetical protein NQ318_015768 [Aromia moschata]